MGQGHRVTNEAEPECAYNIILKLPYVQEGNNSPSVYHVRLVIC